MIIKSMSRKSKSFSQLYDYLMREDSFCFIKNFYSKEKKKLIKEFMRNSDFLENSRGKNYLYHELLSLEKNNLSLEKQKEILLDLTNKYLDLRAQNHLSFAVLHTDKDHFHVHLMISANEIEGEKRIRLSKKDFHNIQKNLEYYKNQRYKELNKSEHYQESKTFEKTKQKEQEIKHRRNTKTIKEQIRQDLEQVFKTARSKTYLDNHLNNQNYEIYTRGKQTGVIYENKKYRFKTLGLDKEYESTLKRLETIKKREIKRQNFKDRKEQTKTRWSRKVFKKRLIKAKNK